MSTTSKEEPVSTNTPTVRILQIGNGKVVVVPSPIELHREQTVVMKNWTECRADVDFGRAPIQPGTASIPPNGQQRFEVKPDAPYGYYEYDVGLLCVVGARERKLYAEGNSKPSVIVDG